MDRWITSGIDAAMLTILRMPGMGMARTDGCHSGSSDSYISISILLKDMALLRLDAGIEQCWSVISEGGCLLVSMTGAQHQRVVEPGADQLQANGQAVIVKTAGNRQSRLAGHVEGVGERGPGGPAGMGPILGHFSASLEGGDRQGRGQ